MTAWYVFEMIVDDENGARETQQEQIQQREDPQQDIAAPTRLHTILISALARRRKSEDAHAQRGDTSGETIRDEFRR